MPKRPKTPCTVHGCPELVAKSGPCLPHAQALDKQRKGSQPWRDYDSRAWEINRAEALRRKPVCECGRPTFDVDHVIPLRLGGTHALWNLNALCHPCHSRKTARETGFGR